MSLRNEQCRKVCRIIDDALANRPAERDSLIIAVQIAFETLERMSSSSPNCSEIPNDWIPVEDKLPEWAEDVLTQLANDDMIVNWVVDEDDREWFYDDVIAWRELPAPYQPKEDE